MKFWGVRSISCACALAVSGGCATYGPEKLATAHAHNSPPVVAGGAQVPSKIVLSEALKIAHTIDYPLPDKAASEMIQTGSARIHEGKAAELWAGRRFYARGKIIDSRTEEKSLAALASANSDGWTILNKGADDERSVHQESGLECPAEIDLTLNEEAEVSGKLYTLEGVTKFDRRGRDVACNYIAGGDAIITLYASFYPDISLEDHAAAAVSAIRQNFNVKGQLPVITMEMKRASSSANSEPPAPFIAGAFDVGQINGAPYKTALWIGKTYGWHVKVRGTFAQEDVGSELVSALMFSMNVLGVSEKNAKNPTTSGPEV